MQTSVCTIISHSWRASARTSASLHFSCVYALALHGFIHARDIHVMPELYTYDNPSYTRTQVKHTHTLAVGHNFQLFRYKSRVQANSLQHSNTEV